MSVDTYAMYEQPLDSVLLDFGKLEQQAASGIYVLPIFFCLMNAVPLAAFIALWCNDPSPFSMIPLFMGAILGGVTVYLFRKLQRYRLARAALGAWALSHGFVGQGRAYVGVVAGRRCAAVAIYRRTGKTEYRFECFALLVQLTSYSNCGMHVQQKPRTLEEAVRMLDAGFNALMQKYCQGP